MNAVSTSPKFVNRKVQSEPDASSELPFSELTSVGLESCFTRSGKITRQAEAIDYQYFLRPQNGELGGT